MKDLINEKDVEVLCKMIYVVEAHSYNLVDDKTVVAH